MPTRDENEEPNPLDGEGRDEADPVVPARVLPHYFEDVPDAVVDALSPALIGVRRAVIDESSRDYQGTEPSPTRAKREIEILAVGEQARIECPDRVDHGGVDQHGAA